MEPTSEKEVLEVLKKTQQAEAESQLKVGQVLAKRADQLTKEEREFLWDELRATIQSLM